MHFTAQAVNSGGTAVTLRRPGSLPEITREAKDPGRSETALHGESKPRGAPAVPSLLRAAVAAPGPG